MSKVKVDATLLDKAREALKEKELLRSSDILSRSELRALERKGYLERVRTQDRKKWVDATSAMQWGYFKKGAW